MDSIRFKLLLCSKDPLPPRVRLSSAEWCALLLARPSEWEARCPWIRLEEDHALALVIARPDLLAPDSASSRHLRKVLPPAADLPSSYGEKKLLRRALAACHALLQDFPELASAPSVQALHALAWPLEKHKDAAAKSFAPHFKPELIPLPAWGRLLKVQPALESLCPMETITGPEVIDLLFFHPALVRRAAWDKLENKVFVHLISLLTTLQPPLRSPDRDQLLALALQHCPWARFKTHDWLVLSHECPQHIERCDWSSLPSEEAALMLSLRPQWRDLIDLSRFDGWDWGLLISKQAALFRPLCPFDKFTIRDWAMFAVKGPSTDFNRIPWAELSGEDWRFILQREPGLAGRCDFAKLSGEDLARMLCDQPQLRPHCDLALLDGWDWGRLLNAQPQFDGECPRATFDSRQWSMFAATREGEDEQIPWDKLENSDKVWLLQRRVDCASHLNLTELGSSDWAKIIEEQPVLESLCPFDDFSPMDHAIFYWNLPERPDLVAWDELDGEAASWLVANINAEQRKGGERAHAFKDFQTLLPWHRLGPQDWVWLLSRESHSVQLCPWTNFTGFHWGQLLAMAPEFASRCPWTKLSGRDRIQLCCYFTPWWRHLPWKELEAHDLIWLAHYIHDYRLHHPQSTLYQDFEKLAPWQLLDGSDAALLLEEAPSFAHLTPYQHIGPFEWSRLVKMHPELRHLRPENN